MLLERAIGIVEEVGEVESMAELQALWCFGQRDGNEYGDAEFVPAFKAAARRLRGTSKPPVQGAVVGEVDVDRLRELEAQLAELKQQVPVVRSGRRYRLLSFDVGWSTKPQVHTIAEVLKAHWDVGDEVDEEDIVEAMVANEGALRTKQGGKRIWDYYKGDHNEGLTAHGNVERC